MARRPKSTSFDLESFLSGIGQGRTIAPQPPNRIIFSQEDPANAVFHIRHGKVKITVTSRRGKEAVLGILGSGDFLGEECLNGHLRRLATATTLTDCSILRFSKNAMISALRDHEEFSKFFITYLLERTIRVEANLVDQLFNSSEKRLARTLLLLANFGKDGTAEPVLTPVSQEMLADMIGTTRAHVSSFMNKFRRLGFVDYNGTLRVHSTLINILLRDGEVD